MSQENVEIVRRANKALNRGDIEGFLTLYDEDVEAEDLMNAPDVPRVVHGIQEFRQMLMAWVERSTSSVRRDHRDWADDKVGRRRGELAQLLTFRDGKVVRVCDFPSHAEALEALGLSE